MQWYFERGSGQEGPVETDALRALLADGGLKPENKVWRKGLADWLPAGDVEELGGAAAPAPVAPATPAEPAAPAEPAPIAVEESASSAPVYVPPAAGHTPSSGAGEVQGEPAGVCTNPIEAFKKVVLENYLNFSGRASRSELWWFTVAWFLLVMISAMMGEALVGLIYLGLFVPYIAVQVRRLHDIGKEWYYFFVAFVPFVGGLILLYWLVQDSEKGSNAFGPNPKGE